MVIARSRDAAEIHRTQAQTAKLGGELDIGIALEFELHSRTDEPVESLARVVPCAGGVEQRSPAYQPAVLRTEVVLQEIRQAAVIDARDESRIGTEAGAAVVVFEVRDPVLAVLKKPTVKRLSGTLGCKASVFAAGAAAPW